MVSKRFSISIRCVDDLHGIIENTVHQILAWTNQACIGVVKLASHEHTRSVRKISPEAGVDMFCGINA